MKIRMPFGRVAFAVAVFFFALVALTPLGLAIRWFGLDTRGLAAREAQGSVWLGALKEAQLGPAPIGDVSARLNSLPLFLGRARVSLARPDEMQRFEGAATVSRHGFGFDDATGQLRLGALLAPLPISAIELQDVSIGFASGLCSRAEGRVRATASGDVGGVPLSAALAGNASCAGDAALIPLVGQSGMEQLNIRLFADGRYRVELLVRSQDATLGQRLVAAGFIAGNGGFARVIDGTF
jgi:general secretion pathway protein N